MSVLITCCGDLLNEERVCGERERVERIRCRKIGGCIPPMSMPLSKVNNEERETCFLSNIKSNK